MKRLIQLFISVSAIVLPGCETLPDTCTGRSQQVQKIEQSKPAIWKIPRSNTERAGWVVERFEQTGCVVGHEFVSDRDGSNLICTFVGDESNEYVIAAHYDTWPGSRGVVDNWSGVMILTRIAEHLRRYPPKNTWRLIAFTGEERGLRGSKIHVENARTLPDAMINLDTLGTGPARFDPRSDPELQCLASAAGLVRSARFRDVTGDWEPFRTRGVPVLAVHAITQRLLPLLHSSRDTSALISADQLELTLHQVLAVVASLDENPIRQK